MSLTAHEYLNLAKIESEESKLHIVCCKVAGSPGVHRAFCGKTVLSDQTNNSGAATCEACVFECEFGDCPELKDCEVIG